MDGMKKSRAKNIDMIGNEFLQFMDKSYLENMIGTRIEQNQALS